jgi:hypothetical protein
MANEADKNVAKESIAANNNKDPKPDHKGFILDLYSRKLI